MAVKLLDQIIARSSTKIKTAYRYENQISVIKITSNTFDNSNQCTRLVIYIAASLMETVNKIEKNTQLCVTTVKNYGTLSAGFANTSSIQNGGRDRDPSVFLPLSVVYIATPKLSLFYRCSA